MVVYEIPDVVTQIHDRRWSEERPRMDLHTAALCIGAASTQQMAIVTMQNGGLRVARSPDF